MKTSPFKSLTAAKSAHKTVNAGTAAQHGPHLFQFVSIGVHSCFLIAWLRLRDDGEATRNLGGDGLWVTVVAQRHEESFERREISRVEAELLEQWIEPRLGDGVASVERLADGFRQFVVKDQHVAQR